tara:strand:- start:398 stop:1054 length:657 start_codon:yes stop_codon:yes gene_type:complete
MKKILALLTLMFLLSACASPMALLGPAAGATNGKLVQSSVQSAFSLGVKKTTGKSPMQHALAYAEEKNPNKEKKRCISFIEKTNSEACAIVKKQAVLTGAKVKKQAALTGAKVKKKTKSFFKKNILNKKNVVNKKVTEAALSPRGQAFAKAKKQGKDYFIFNSKIYNTRFKGEETKKKIKSKSLFFVKKNENKNLIKSKKSVMEQALDIQAALNKIKY